MISQISNQAGYTPPVNTGQTATPTDVKQQKAAARVELPNQAVQSVEKGTSSEATGNVVEKVDAESLKKAAEQINKVMQQFNTNIQFSVDEDTKTNVVKVIDRETEEVIRQIPTKEMLEIAKALDSLQGLLVRDKA